MSTYKQIAIRPQSPATGREYSFFFSRAVRASRTTQKIARTDLAIKTLISVGTLAGFEDGELDITVPQIHKIASALNTTTEVLSRQAQSEMRRNLSRYRAFQNLTRMTLSPRTTAYLRSLQPVVQ